MQPLTTAVLRYLNEILGLKALGVSPWSRATELPYFLQDAFEFNELAMLGRSAILAMGRPGAGQSLSEICVRLDKVKAFTDQPVVYVTDALVSYERRRLIEQKVPFIVPGNQLYLPDMGLDLREYFRQRAPAAESALSPSAQAMLIVALLRQPWQSDWLPSDIAVALGYTPMTLSRAVRELTAAGLATAHTVGRSRRLRMELPPEQIWERAKPALRTPVRRTVWVAADGIECYWPIRRAGLSALALCSMLAAPKWPVYAISSIDWKAAQAAGVRALLEPEAGAQEWQLWSYSPTLMPGANTVDPLSLMLSLQDHVDDRVNLALNELKGQLPW